MRYLRTVCACCALVAFAALFTFAGREQKKPAFTVEITSQAGRALPDADNFGLVGIEQTLVAKVTPAVEGAEYEWTVGAPVLRTYEHDAQKAEKHKPIALTAKDRGGPQLSFFWTKPQDGAEVKLRVRKGADEVTATAAFVVRLPRDPNRDIYSFADNDPRRNPNGLKATYAITKDHRSWHLGLKMDNGETPVFNVLKDPVEKTVWGDVGYQRDPARMFGLDFNGSGATGVARGVPGRHARLAAHVPRPAHGHGAAGWVADPGIPQARAGPEVGGRVLGCTATCGWASSRTWTNSGRTPSTRGTTAATRASPW